MTIWTAKVRVVVNLKSVIPHLCQVLNLCTVIKNKECKGIILMCQVTVYTVKVRAVVILESVNPHLCKVQQKLLGMVAKSKKTKRKHSNVLVSRKINISDHISDNEVLENLTKNSRNKTENSYFTTNPWHCWG